MTSIFSTEDLRDQLTQFFWIYLTQHLFCGGWKAHLLLGGSVGGGESPLFDFSASVSFILFQNCTILDLLVRSIFMPPIFLQRIQLDQLTHLFCLLQPSVQVGTLLSY